MTLIEQIDNFIHKKWLPEHNHVERIETTETRKINNDKPQRTRRTKGSIKVRSTA